MSLHKTTVFFLLIFTVVLSSCKKFEKAPIPAYLYIKPITLKTANDNTQGDNSALIKDAWIDVNGISIGSYGIPSLIPVVQTGNVKLNIKGGIVNSGQDEQRIIYPFYTSYETTLNLQPQKIDTIESIINFVQGVKFTFIEDFTFASDKFQIVKKFKNDSILIINDSNGWKKGNNYGKFKYDDTIANINILAIMNTPNFDGFDKPSVRSRVYLEFDYKSNVDFNVGMQVRNNGRLINFFSILNVNSKVTWNKIYLELTSEFIKLANDDKFKLFFSVNKKADGQTDFNFDNVKLLYFE